MIEQEDLIKIRLSEPNMHTCVEHATLCAIGGASHIRSVEDREDNLNMDQIIGQVCTCAASMYLLGEEDGFHRYNEVREAQNLTPYDGDGGDDIPPLKIDIKGSFVKNTSKALLTFNLLVRPRELHNGFTYVLALSRPPHVVLMGWAHSKDFSEGDLQEYGIFKGAYRLEASRLRPMTDLLEILADNRNSAG
jgi:hypothetical protein